MSAMMHDRVKDVKVRGGETMTNKPQGFAPSEGAKQRRKKCVHDGQLTAVLIDGSGCHSSWIPRDADPRCRNLPLTKW